MVEASTENISIGSALPGVVLEVFVPVEKVGTIVKAGDPLFKVDDRALQAQLKYQQASVYAAERSWRSWTRSPGPRKCRRAPPR